MPSLGRLPQFDARSRAFPIRSLVAAKPPRSYTWSCGVTIDQGMEGSCVGHAWAHELAARPRVIPGVGHDFARRVYFDAQRIDEWDGGAYPGAAPFYEGTSVLAGAKVVKALGAMDEYRWAFGLSDLILAVGYAGPAVLGINWYEGMFDPDPSGLVRVSGDVAGGHAIVANGVSVKRRLVRLHNSWGPGWGVGGHAFIGWDDLERLLHEQGEACIPVGRKEFVP